MHPRTIGARVAGHAKRKPHEIFCTFLSSQTAEDITFGDLFERATAYARLYQARGVRQGDIVIIILRHTPHLYYSFLGALLAGAIPSFMPFPSAKQRSDIYWHDHESLFERLRPRLVVTYEENRVAAHAYIDNFSVETLVPSASPCQPSADAAPANLSGLAASADDVACLQHSSGTTGLKKGVMLTHRAILDHTEAYSKRLSFTSDDCIVSWLPLYHDMGFIACFMTSVIEGTRLIALDPFEWVMRPQLLLEAIQRYRPSLCWLPNFAFSHIVNATQPGATFDLSSMRAFVNCSEPCKPGTFERFLKRFEGGGITRTNLHICYALAENVFAATQTTLDEAATVIRVDAKAFSAGTILPAGADKPTQDLLSCGLPLDGVSITVRGEDGTLLPPDIIGEIFVASTFLFSGYYLQQDLTDTKLHDGWYQTGDLGFMHDGELFVTGRVDDMLIVNGRNYYAHEIEYLVSEVPGVLAGRSVAIGVDDQQHDATVVVVLVECTEPIGQPDDLARFIRRRVLERLGLAIHSIVPLRSGQLVKTTSGKISRIKNKQLYIQGTLTSLGDVSATS
jgi:acyl-CoA synthetase (AMP-forming)/AMP-acid ligase II